MCNSSSVTSGLLRITLLIKSSTVVGDGSTENVGTSGSGIIRLINLLNTHNMVRRDGWIYFGGWCGIGRHFIFQKFWKTENIKRKALGEYIRSVKKNMEKMFTEQILLSAPWLY